MRNYVAIAVALTVLTITGVAFAGGGHGPPPVNWLDFDYNKDTQGPGVIWAFLNFSILVGLLVWKGGPPIRSYLQTRHRSIRDALEEGEKLRAEAQAKLEEYEGRVSKIDEEVEELLTDIRATAETEKERILAAANRQAESIKAEAERKISADLERTKAELEREVIAVAVAAAERILKDRVTADDHNQLIDQFVADVSRVPQGAAQQERN